VTDDFTVPGGDGLVRTSSGEQAALYIRRLIFEGQLEPGSRVPQNEIARTLGISRIPLREALIALEREGWVTLEMHRGAFVNALDERTVRDHYEVFGLIYGLAVKQALERSGPEMVDKLGALANELRGTDDPAESSAVLLQFQATVLSGAQSERIKAVLLAMSSIVPGDEFFRLVPNAIEVERRALPEILGALRRGDGDQAAHSYQVMMRSLADEVVDVLRERGMLETALTPG
jgi:DNA-binding GntR family transcriptional regulator